MKRYLWYLLFMSIYILLFPSPVNGKVTLEEIQVRGADERSSIDISIPEAQMARLHPVALSTSGTDFAKSYLLNSQFLLALPANLPQQHMIASRIDYVTTHLLNAQLLLGLPANLSQQHIIVSRADYVKTHDLANLSIVDGKISTVDPPETPILTLVPTYTSIPPTDQKLQATVTHTKMPNQVENVATETPIPENDSDMASPTTGIQTDGGVPESDGEILAAINQLVNATLKSLGWDIDVQFGWLPVAFLLGLIAIITFIIKGIDFPLGWATLLIAIATAWVNLGG